MGTTNSTTVYNVQSSIKNIVLSTLNNLNVSNTIYQTIKNI